MIDQLTGITNRPVVTVTAGAALISYRQSYGLMTTHGETGMTGHVLHVIVGRLILTASMLFLDANRRYRRVPPLGP